MYYQKHWFKIIYIFMSLVLWFLVGMLVHWLLEWPVLYFLTKDFYAYSLDLSYNVWLAIHNVVSFIILLASIFVGLYFGFRWYDYIYIQRRKNDRF